MSCESPVLDDRDAQALLQQLRALANQDVSEWSPGSNDDAGTMLQRVFARLLGLALRRLNCVPEKNLLAFLETMGVSLLPPSPARVPLTFSLTPGLSVRVVPAGSQAGTKPGGQGPAVVFETDDDLTVIPAQLQEGYTVDPTWDLYADQSPVLRGQSQFGFTPFVGTEPIPHVLYLGDDELLDFVGATTINLWFLWKSGSPQLLNQFFGNLSYRYVTNGMIKAATLPLATLNGSGNSPQVSLSLQDPIDEETIQGVGIAQTSPSRWLKITMTTPLPDSLAAQDLSLSQIVIAVTASKRLPDLAFSEKSPVDLTKDFRPFGDSPRAGGSTFYIGSEEVLAKPGAAVTVNTVIQPPDPPTLIWEYWNGTTLVEFPPQSVVDSTASFTQAGKITLLRPDITKIMSSFTSVVGASPSLASYATAVVGTLYQTAFRVRIASGSYRNAPSVNNFQLSVKPTTLAQDAKPGDTQVVLSDANFATTGSVLKVVGGATDFILVSRGSSPDTFTFQPAFPANGKGHVKGETVELKGVSLLYRATLVAATNPKDKTFMVNAPPSWSRAPPQSGVMLISDSTGTEFVQVQKVEQTPGGSSASFTITVSPGLANAHPAGGAAPSTVYVSPVTDSPDLVGFANHDYVDFVTASAKAIKLFGDTPAPGDFFYFFSSIGFPDSLTIDVALSQASPTVNVTWEYFGQGGWTPIENKGIALTPDLHNTFLASGSFSFQFPTATACVPTEVNGKTNCWIRARLVGGNYGLPVAYMPVDPVDPSKGFTVQPGTGNVSPPMIKSLTLDYSAARPPCVVIQNGFLHSCRPPEEAQVFFAPFLSVRELSPAYYADPDPALYLGFNAASPELPVTLYLDVASRAFTGSVIKESGKAAVRSSTLPALRWEYFNGAAWKALTVLDGTANMTESRTVKFLTPTDIAALAKFSSTQLYYVRARSAANDPFNTQSLSGIYLNTVSATQSTIVESEILGSGSGQPHQSMSFAHPPIQPEQQVVVQEPETPTDSELQTVKTEEGADAVQELVNPATGKMGIWVRWHEVPNFLMSDPHSRHYVLDHSTGALTFGDNAHGMIPPRGIDNVTATYDTGGGAAGDVADALVSQIKSTLPGVAAVTNPVASDGGAEEETIHMVKERGPQILRHRYRAVSSSDVEWIVRQGAGTAVARTKTLPNVNRDLRFEPGWVTVIVVPRSSGRRPSPSSELLAELETYVQPYSYLGLTQQADPRINLMGPGYVQVSAMVEIVPQNINAAEQVKEAALSALTGFLHPLTGGLDGTGWEFGRNVYASEVFQVLQDVSGVNHVESLRMIPNVAQYRLGLSPAQAAGTSLPEGSVVMTPDRKKMMITAGLLQAGAKVGLVDAKGFKEGDRVTVVVDLTNPKANGNTVAVDSFATQVAFPRGSMVMSLDGSVVSHLAVGIPAGVQQSELSLEDDSLSLAASLEGLTVLYPFPMTVTSIVMNRFRLTFQSASGNTMVISPFQAGDAGLPAGTPVSTSAEPAIRTELSQGILPGSVTKTQIVVDDQAFGQALRPGDVIFIDSPIQTLGIELYETKVVIPAQSLIATLDNRVRAPLLKELGQDQEFTSLEVGGFVTGDQVVLARRDGTGEVDGLTVTEAAPIADTVYLDDNFLAYSGNHEISVVEEYDLPTKLVEGGNVPASGGVLGS